MFRPRWIVGHVLVVVTVVVFVSLGFWQLRRLDEKRAFNDAVAQAIAGEPVDVDRAGEETFVRVQFRGTFDTRAEALVLRGRNGVSGHHVLTPVDLGNGRGLLVDRGWVPIEVDAPRLPETAPPAGEVTVEGVLWPAQEGGLGAGLRDVVPRIDPLLHQAATAFDLDEARYVVMLSSIPAGDGLPIADEPPPLSEGPHLGYAVQWFLFTAVVVVGYPILVRRRAR